MSRQAADWGTHVQTFAYDKGKLGFYVLHPMCAESCQHSELENTHTLKPGGETILGGG